MVGLSAWVPLGISLAWFLEHLRGPPGRGQEHWGLCINEENVSGVFTTLQLGLLGGSKENPELQPGKAF